MAFHVWRAFSIAVVVVDVAVVVDVVVVVDVDVVESTAKQKQQ